MAVPFPTEVEVNLSPPDEGETVRNAAGVLSATCPAGGPSDVQRLLLEATFRAMTGHEITVDDLPHLGPEEFAEHLRRRSASFRMRTVHMMILSALVLRPLPRDVADRVATYSSALGIDDTLLATVADFASADRALAAVDFERNGYTAGWSAERSAALHTASTLASGWAAAEDDPALAVRWEALGELDPGSLGHHVHRFYRARGFAHPGAPGSAPPLLAQHDWVHVLADYGTRVESELEVFAFIARANDDPRGFSLLAMVVSLFETGYLAEGAGLFEAFPGQLSAEGMAVRVGDAMRRGALSHGLHGAPDVDFMSVDWFEQAHRPVEEVRQMFGVVERSADAIAAGSVTPWEPGGISEARWANGHEAAAAAGRRYQAFGARP